MYFLLRPSHSLKHGCAADMKHADVPQNVALRVTGHASARSYAGYGGPAAARRAVAAQTRQRREAVSAAASAEAAAELAAWSASAAV